VGSGVEVVAVVRGAGLGDGSGASSPPVIWQPAVGQPDRATAARSERAILKEWLSVMLVGCLLDHDRP
jgi:hypothetical protein